MPKQHQVTVAAGAGFTDIPATIPCHLVRIWPNGDRNVAALEYKLPDDDYTITYTTDVTLGDIIELVGPGKSGLLGHQAAMSASLQAATILAKVRFADSLEHIVNVYEE